MKDEKEKAAIRRVILATGEAMEKQLLIEDDDIENDLTARLDTARTIAVVALSKAFKDDEQTMYEVLNWFCENLAAHLVEMTSLTNETKNQGVKE